MSYSIVEHRPGEPMLRIIIDDYEVFGMTLNPVEPGHRVWLAEILERSFAEAIEKAVRRARSRDQAEMRKLLGIG